MTKQISTEHEGETYEGSYEIDGDFISVHCRFGSKEAQLGGSAANPEGLAGALLDELVTEGLRRSKKR